MGNFGDGGPVDPSEDSPEGLETVHPRRTLLVRFTCGDCGASTERMVSRRATKKGTIFVQCGGCEKWHLLVDNLDQVEEYRIDKETGEAVRWRPDDLPDPVSGEDSPRWSESPINSDDE